MIRRTIISSIIYVAEGYTRLILIAHTFVNKGAGKIKSRNAQRSIIMVSERVDFPERTFSFLLLELNFGSVRSWLF